MRRVLTFGVLLCVLVAPVAACGDRFDDLHSDAAGTSAPPPSPTLQPGEVLAKAATAIEKVNLRYTLKAEDDTIECVYDARTGGTRLSGGTGASRVDFAVFPGELFIEDSRVKALYRVDAAKVPADSTLTFLSEPLFARAFLAGATGVRENAEGNLTGALDLTKVPAGTGRSKAVADAFAKAAGARATDIPFTAMIDAEGRLTGIKATFPGADKGKDLVWDLTVVEIGGAASVPRPTGYKELPAEKYKDM
jgi:hypothetical protein